MITLSYDYHVYDKPNWTEAAKAHGEAWLKLVMNKSGLVEKARVETEGHVDVLCEVPVPA